MFWTGFAVIVMGVVDLVTACVLGAKGWTVNEFYGWAMAVTAALIVGFAWFFWKTNMQDQKNHWGAPWGVSETAFMTGLLISVIITGGTAYLVLTEHNALGWLGWVPLVNVILAIATPTVAYGVLAES
jgi:hypothetical protein